MPVQTPFHPRTSELCSSFRWKDWAGYLAVCSYDPVIDSEYYAIRQTAGLLDVSPLYKYELRGRSAAEFLSWVFWRDIQSVKAHRVVYSGFCDHRGKVIDDGTITNLGNGTYRITTASPSLRWFQEQSRGFEVEIKEVTEDIAALALQGPTSRLILESLIDGDLGDLRFFRHTRAKLMGGIHFDITRTGYTGDLGYELWIDRDSALTLWDSLMDVGRPFGIRPIGLDALDVSRVEAGFILQGVDYFSAPLCEIEARKSTPFEIGLGPTVQLDRDPFIGQASLRREKERGSDWYFVGLDLDWDEIEALYDRYGLSAQLGTSAWRSGIPIFDGKRTIGQATSGAWSPILKKNLALGTIESGYELIGTKVQVEHTVEYRRHTVAATVVERPFFNPERKRK